MLFDHFMTVTELVGYFLENAVKFPVLCNITNMLPYDCEVIDNTFSFHSKIIRLIECQPTLM